MLREAGSRFFRMFYVILMTIISALDGLGSGTSVSLHLAGVSPGDSGFVHHIAHLASNPVDFILSKSLARKV